MATAHLAAPSPALPNQTQPLTDTPTPPEGHPLDLREATPFRHCVRCGAQSWRTLSAQEQVCTACGHRHFLTPIPAALAVVVDSSGRVLLIRRAHEPGLGKLGVPGGVIEPEETGEMAAARETREETGLELPPQAFHYLCTLNNRYLFQGYRWPTLDLCYLARVQDFGPLQPDLAEVQETLLLPLAEVPMDDFAFGTNAEAVRRAATALAAER